MKTLFIAPSLPLPTGSGGSMRSHQLYQQLRGFSDVDVLTCNSVGVPFPAVREFRRGNVFLRNVAIPSSSPNGGRPPHLHPQLAQSLARTHYDYLVVRYHASAYWLGLLGLQNVILDCDDCYLELLHQLAHDPARGRVRRLLARRRLTAFRPRYERQLSGVRAVLFSRQSSQVAWADNFHLLPNRLPPPGASPRDERGPLARHHGAGPVILFVGVLSYGPNAEGLDRFLKSVWPRVVQEHPRALLRVVGRGLLPALERQWRTYRRVELCGYVDDLRAEYDRADFSIAPVYRGSGTHIKVMESLLLGKTMVLSSHATRGYEKTLRDGESLLVADTDADYTSAVLRLIGDPDLRRRLALKGQRQVRRHHLATPRDAELRELMVGRGPVNEREAASRALAERPGDEGARVTPLQVAGRVECA